LKKWINLIPAFFIAGLTYPLLYVLDLQTVYGGVLLKVATAAIIAVAIGFAIYPFIKGVEKYKSGNIKAAVALIVSGVVFPGASGVAAIVLIEYFGVGKRINE
jgi:hypothetical protein